MLLSRLARVSMLIILSSGCDDKSAMPGSGARDLARSAALPAATAPGSRTAAAAGGPASADGGDEGGARSALTMPERPIPKPQTTVSASSPIDVQQRTIAYFMAMKAPRLDDASSDPAFAAETAKKLEPILLSMDPGADKARMNRVEVQANGRQLDLLMAAGCDAKTPARAVVQRAGISFPTLVSHGVFVLRCNDAHVQCLQSTRDPDDVLCATGIRHK